MSNRHLPAIHHDEKAVLVRGDVVFTFLWKKDSPNVHVQRDKLADGKKQRDVREVPKHNARKFWNLMLDKGYIRFK